jgi:tetratricopeptide (TPR) repeat protein
VPFKFTGKIVKLTIAVDPPKLTPEDVKKLKEAETKFYAGDFDSSIAILEDLLKRADFPVTKKKTAYELLAQNYLAKSYQEQARAAIKKLLELVPNYVGKLPVPPYGSKLDYNPTTGTVKVVNQ